MTAPSDLPALRLVLDTNVVVAGLLWNGPPRRLIELAIDGEAIELFTSRVLIAELAGTLSYPKFAARLAAFGTSVSALVGQYGAIANVVAPASVPRVVPGDADDDHVIAAAVAAGADSIVTGDRRHLLPLRSWQGIAIVSARDVVDRIQASRN